MNHQPDISGHDYKKRKRLSELQSIVKNFNQFKEIVSYGQELAKLGTWVHNLITGEILFTKEVYSILGCSPAAYERSLIYPDDLDMVNEAVRGVMSGKEYDIEYRVLPKDGGIKYVREKTKTIYDDNNSPVKMIGFIQDITEYKTQAGMSFQEQETVKYTINKPGQQSHDNSYGLEEYKPAKDAINSKVLEDELNFSYRVLSQILTVANMGSWQMHIAERSILFSEEACRIYGMNPNDYDNTYEDFIKRVHPDDRVLIEDMLANPSTVPVELEFRYVRTDGSMRNIYQLVEFTFDHAGNPAFIFGTIQDITDKKELEEELEQNQERISRIQRRFNAMIKESSDVYEILDPDGTILYISEASEKVIGYKPEERIDKKIYEYYDEVERQKLTEMMEYVLLSPRQKVQRDIIFKGKDGKSRYLDVHMQNFLHDPAIKGIVVNFRDVTFRVEMEKSITHLSTHDDLTGLPNNRYIKTKLETLCQDEGVTDNGFAVFMLDIDSYKSISDTLGYQFGEQYIIQISTRLKAYCGSEKFLGRYTGDRFVIIVDKGVDTEEGYKTIAEEILELFSRTVKVDKYFLDVNVSMGISIYRSDVLSNEMIIRQAETALFLAKKEGRNKYKFYSKETHIHDYKQFELRNDLRNAIVDKQFRVSYQPIIDLKSNEVLAAEALIRWEHPKWGMVSPADFIPLAEETEFIINIGDWLLREVCLNYRQWLDEGLPKIKMSVNYSSIQFYENNFVEKVLAIIKDFELDPGFLIMEITESVLMIEAEKAVSVIKRLQSYGIQIALDDFGTGFSSLAYLSSFNINILKLDGSFIKSAILDENSNIITKSIINMAKELKIKLVAEGIEKWEQLSYLLDLECHAGQGYLYSKPLPYKDFALAFSKGKCEPANISQGIGMAFEDRRKFFRVKFPHLLEANLMLKEFRGRTVNAGNAKVFIKDIGPGGLCFISKMRIPTEKSVLLQFTTELNGKEIKLNGSPVWSDETVDDFYEYGIEFRINENERMHLTEQLIECRDKIKIVQGLSL